MNNDYLMKTAEKFSNKRESSITCQALTHTDLSPAVLDVAQRLAVAELNCFCNTYNSKKLDRGFGQLFAVLGFQYAYMGKILTQLIFWMTAGGVGLWYLYDIFKIQQKIRSENEYIALEALDTARGF